MTRRDAILTLAAGAPIPPAHLLVEIRTQRTVEAAWPRMESPIAAGSLLKPFAAIAYGASHGWRYPVVECKGCWKPEGHGRLDLVHAIAVSCNGYFLELARACVPEDVHRVAATYELPGPAGDRPEDWIGLTAAWKATPSQLLRGYSELMLRAALPGPSAVLSGMRLAAQSGTAKALNGSALAKTGTAPCSHQPRGMADGLAVVLFPPESPRWALLAGLHNEPGSNAAANAARLIQHILS